MADPLHRRPAIKALAQSSEGMPQNPSEQKLVSYFERRKVFGEYPTIQWLVAKHRGQ